MSEVTGETPENQEMDSQQESATEHMEADQKAAAAPPDPTVALQAEISELKDKYLRLYSDFDNFRKRTTKEKNELFKSAGEDVVVALLPVLDDFDRAQKSLEAKANDAMKAELSGYTLIYNKLQKVLQQKGMRVMDDAKGQDLNPDLQEAITQIPVADEAMKGKVVDVIEKGYYMGDKVIRVAKVILGA